MKRVTVFFSRSFLKTVNHPEGSLNAIKTERKIFRENQILLCFNSLTWSIFFHIRNKITTLMFRDAMQYTVFGCKIVSLKVIIYFCMT